MVVAWIENPRVGVEKTFRRTVGCFRDNPVAGETVPMCEIPKSGTFIPYSGISVRPLDALLSQPEQRLIGTVLAHPDQEFGTLELLSRMGSSRSTGSAVIQRCVESGLLKERRVGNQRRLAANPDFILYPELRRIVLKTVGLAEPLALALTPVAGRLKEAFVFGSVASGKDRTDSDIDVALVGDVDLFSISPLLDAAQQELGREVHANIYSEQEWASTEDPVIRSIRSGPRIDLMEALRGPTN